MRLSLPSKDKAKYITDPKGWKKAVEIVQNAMKRSGFPFEVAEGEAAFYGPKVDFQIKSVIGREESASTNQLDFAASKRFSLNYIDKDGKEKPVFVIHRAPLGSHERFIAFLIEHYAGAFPLWLSPVQVSILPVSDKFMDYAQKMRQQFEEGNIRVAVDSDNKTLGAKIREAALQKIPYLCIIGEKEIKNGRRKVSVRTREGKDLGTSEVNEFIKKIKTEIESKI